MNKQEHNTKYPVDDSTPKQGKSGKVLLVIIMKVVVLLVVCYFWYRYVRKNWDELSARSWEIGWRSIVFSSVFFFIGYVNRGCLWAPMCFELTGERIPVISAFRASALAWMGRYVPGKVWAVAGKAYFSVRNKTQIPRTGVAVTVEILWFQLSGILLTVIVLVFSRGAFLSSSIRAVSVVLLIIGFIAGHPRVFYPIANTVLKVLRQPPLTQRPRYRIMLLVMLGNVITFLLWSVSFTILAGPISSIDFHDFPLIVGIFSAAWVVGFLVLLVPAGIGVRESILAFGLRSMEIPDPIIITLVLVSRVLMTLVELVCFLLALAIPILGLRSGPSSGDGSIQNR